MSTMSPRPPSLDCAEHGARQQPAFWVTIRQVLNNRGFVACALLLLVLTVGFQVWTRKMQFRKLPLPPKHRMQELKQERLVGYKLLRVPPLHSDVQNQLGTDDLVQWLVQEWDPAENRPVGPVVSLFVTYYTGMPDVVPHIPEVCYQGSGFDVVSQTEDSLVISSGGREQTIPIQVLLFRKAGQFSQSERIVAYTFHANGRFREDRLAVRAAIGSLTDRYAYFSKVEVGVEVEPGRTTKEQAIAAAKRFMRVVIPVLLEDHWPDWEAANRRPASQPADAARS
jgi:hypothetical protein